MNIDILTKVFDHAKVVDEWCARNGGIRVMTALFGSQNYGLATTKSDVDTKSIIVPNLDDWTWGDTDKYNTTIELLNGEHAETKSLPDMCKQFIKCNINFIEILYTDYVDIAPGWEWLYNEFVSVRDRVVRHNDYKAAQTWLGYERQALHRAFNSTSVALGYREDCEYNPKALMNAFRIKESFIRFFQKGQDFKSAIDVCDMRGILLDVKLDPFPKDIAEMYEKDLVNWFDSTRDWVFEHLENKETFNCDYWFKATCKVVYAYLAKEEVDLTY